MGNNDPKQDFTNALNTGQEIPVTINPQDIFQKFTMTSQNTGVAVPQLPGPTVQPAPQKELSDSEVRTWIADHAASVDTHGDVAILYVDTLLEPTDLLFQRIQSLLGKQLVFLRSGGTASRTLQMWDEPDVLPNEPTDEELIEMEAQRLISQEIRRQKIERRFSELREDAANKGEIDEWRPSTVNPNAGGESGTVKSGKSSKKDKAK